MLRTATRRLMSTLRPVSTSNAPPAAASYSQAMKLDKLIFVSGQVPLKPEGTPVEGSITDKAEQVFANVSAILKESNSSLERVAKVNVFLTDINDFAEFNKVYARYFTAHKPARSCVAVKALPLNSALEMEVIATENE